MAHETTTTKWDVNHEPTNEDHETWRGRATCRSSSRATTACRTPRTVWCLTRAMWGTTFYATGWAHIIWASWLALGSRSTAAGS